MSVRQQAVSVESAVPLAAGPLAVLFCELNPSINEVHAHHMSESAAAQPHRFCQRAYPR